MVSISDILKGVKKEETSQQRRPAKVKKEEAPVEAGRAGIRIAPMVMERGRVLNKEESAEIYREAISLLKEIKEKALTNDVLECKPVISCVDRLVEQLIMDNESLPELTTGSIQHDRYNHEVNVCILSIKIGIGLGYDKAELMELGISAILHDTGMIKYMDLANRPGNLTAEEFNEIKNHPETGSDILKRASDLPEIAARVALQEHERMDGSGYPRGLKGKDIHKYARIVGLADSYEAMTHSRPYRDRYMSMDAIRKLSKAKNAYEYKLIKTLLEVTGAYPVGSLVRLNTKETGRVAGINQGFPTRPVINIMYDRDNRKLKDKRVVDLKKQPAVYIEKVLQEEDKESFFNLRAL